jgi:hypothetical protein
LRSTKRLKHKLSIKKLYENRKPLRCCCTSSRRGGANANSLGPLLGGALKKWPV